MNHLSLFSGIGGLDLAAEWAGFTTVAFVERDPYCQRVLARHWPGVHCFPDVRGVTLEAVLDADRRRREGSGLPIQRPREGGEGNHAHADGAGEGWIVSGGFPCQPHSVAGKRQASADDRDLWPEVTRVLRSVRPRWFVGENVRGLLHSESGRFFGSILGDLADMGYRVGWGVWGASDVGALHQRERVFIVARRMADASGAPQGRGGVQGPGESGRAMGEGATAQPLGSREDVADAERERGRCRHSEREDAADARQPSRYSLNWRRLAQPGLGDLVDGLPGWMVEPRIPRVAVGMRERVHKLRALGNAVMPGQAYPLFRAIAEIERVNY